MGIFDFGADSSEIEEALQDLDISELEVSVDESTVTISGVAASESVRKKALAIASKFEGVEEVVDDLSVEEEEDEEEEDEDEDEDDNDYEDDEQVHKVVYGDTLWALAQKYYGDGSKYMKIFNANKKYWAKHNNDPNIIQVGWELVIPED
jgi:nucleoid-associated protein YgaU